MRFHLRSAGWTAGIAALLVSVAAVAGDDGREDGDALLQRVKAHMSEHLAHLPNYMCHETTQRMMRTRSTWQHLDTIDLDVVFTARGELFSRAGDQRFGEEPIEKLVSSGTIGNVAMGSNLDLLLSQGEAQFTYAGPCKKEGHKSLRFDITVPIEKSHFLVRHNGRQGMAGYQGALWVDAETYDPVRVDFKVNRIPPYIGVYLIEESLFYKKLMIGNSEFDLPERSQLAVTDQEGNYTLNLMKLAACHEFTADSVVKYGSPTQGTASRQDQDHR